MTTPAASLLAMTCGATGVLLQRHARGLDHRCQFLMVRLHQRGELVQRHRLTRMLATKLTPDVGILQRLVDGLFIFSTSASGVVDGT